MKPPGHPNPSGDREIARLFLRALGLAGHDAFVASQLRLREPEGDAGAQRALVEAAGAETARLLAGLAGDPPALWFTYHSYWKAPDLIGPAVSAALGIPYVIAEPSHSPSRAIGPWAGFAAAAERALLAADRLIWTKPRDLPALQALVAAERLCHLPPFLDPGPEPAAPPPSDTLRLLTVAMMRAGDKAASYAALAAALEHLPQPWSLTIVGDGPLRTDVAAMFARFPAIRFMGAITDPARLRRLYESHDLLVWPGIGEGIGMVYLEAQAAGLPALAAAHPGPAAVLARRDLPAPGDAAGFARAIAELAGRPGARAEARAHVVSRHGLRAAAERLGAILAPLLP
ncbi:MAG: glycosyltransferase [Alphaproteobacteria bacterium]|nr:MAG: glycosyltransferase [Alphaproteobacteria bacterium]